MKQLVALSHDCQVVLTVPFLFGSVPMSFLRDRLSWMGALFLSIAHPGDAGVVGARGV